MQCIPQTNNNIQKCDPLSSVIAGRKKQLNNNNNTSVFNCKCICIQREEGRRGGNTFATCNRKKGTKESCQVRDLSKHNILVHIYHIYVYNTSVEQQQQPQKFPSLLFLTSSSSSTADCQLRSEREREQRLSSARLSFQRACWIVCFDSESGPPHPPLPCYSPSHSLCDGPAG